MLDKLDKYLEALVLLPGPSGHEQLVAAFMEHAFKQQGLSVAMDIVGNCIASFPVHQVEKPTVMVFAHMDSLGFFVRHIEENGFLRLERLGGIPEKALPGKKVMVLNRQGVEVPGVVGVKQHHLTPEEEKYAVEKYINLFVDIGARSLEDVLALGIDIGSPVAYRPQYQRLLGNRRLGSTLDNRTGCAALLMLAEMLRQEPSPNNVILVGTVWEELNLRGAMMAARTVQPDLAICLDGGTAGDTPEMAGYNSIHLGDGPILTYYNFHGRGTLNGMIPHPGMVRMMEQAATRAGIAYQKNVVVGGLTDAAYLQLEQDGVPCVDVGIPRRYTHGPAEVADLQDVAGLCRWVHAALQQERTNICLKRGKRENAE